MDPEGGCRPRRGRRDRGRWWLPLPASIAAADRRDHDGRRPVGGGGDHSRRRRDPAYRRRQQARRPVRPRLRACAGPVVADGIPAPHRPRTPVRSARPGDASAGSVPPHRRVRPRRPRGVVVDARLGPAAGQRLRRRRQCVHRDASRRQTAAGVLTASLRAGAVDRRRCPGLGEDDGLGLERQLLVRIAAPRSDRRGWRRTHGGADAGVCGGRPEYPHRVRWVGRGGSVRWIGHGTL